MKQMPLIDSHAHLDFPDYKSDLDMVVRRAADKGVIKIINIGADLERSRRGIEIAEKYENIWASVGVHPEDLKVDIKKADAELRKLISSSKKVVAIGECGLDYFYDESKKTEQKALFQMQLDLAKEYNLPIVIHVRNGQDQSASRDAYELLKKTQIKKGVIHCFTLDKAWAKKFLNLGFYIGFTGIITYKNAELVRESAKFVPIEKILIETDCPYLAPQNYRGQRNEPAYICEIAQKLAEIKNLTIDNIGKQTELNAEKLFHI